MIITTSNNSTRIIITRVITVIIEGHPGAAAPEWARRPRAVPAPARGDRRGAINNNNNNNNNDNSNNSN